MGRRSITLIPMVQEDRDGERKEWREGGLCVSGIIKIKSNQFLICTTVLMELECN